MVSLVVCNRMTEGNCSREKLTGVELKGNVEKFKKQITDKFGVELDKCDVIYCGQCLKNEASLESYGIHKDCTVHVVSKKTRNTSTKIKCDLPQSEIKAILSTLQSALKSSVYKSTVENIINTPELLHDIVNEVPGLDANPSTLSLFLDNELLVILGHTANMRRVLEAHPCFLELARIIAAKVEEAGSNGELALNSTTGAYSLDNMSDDDEEDSVPAASQPITANQLAAALATATSSSGIPNSTLVSGSGIITPDFFQQAIIQAQSAALTANHLQHMREMGITDENVARQALLATNGDLHAALDLIFGGLLN